MNSNTEEMEAAAAAKAKRQANGKGKVVVKDSQRSQIEKENQIDTANMLYTKEELDMLKKLSPEDQKQIMSLNKPKKRTVAFQPQPENVKKEKEPTELVQYWDGYENKFTSAKRLAQQPTPTKVHSNSMVKRLQTF